MKTHLIMPMGGKGSRFKDYDFPKPLLNIKGKPFFFWATESIARNVELIDITFVVLQEHVEKHEIDKKIYDFYPDAKIIIIQEVLNGAVLTCAEGVREINDDYPIIFNDCDHVFESKEFENFCNKERDSSIEGGLLTFEADSPKYSFLKLDENENVIETVEKVPISNQAICGCYYFSSKDLFLDTMEEYLKECEYKEFFVSGMYNIIACNGGIIKAFKTDFHVPFGVPEEYEEAIKSKVWWDK